MAKLFIFSIFIFLFFCFSEVFSSDELEINADQFTYDKNNTRIYATGNVEVIDDLFKLSLLDFLKEASSIIDLKSLDEISEIFKKFFIYNFDTLSSKLLLLDQFLVFLH